MTCVSVERPKAATSQIGRMACRVNLREREVLIALRVHIDGSGKPGDSYMTVAAFAGNDELWEEFEKQWGIILQNHSPRAEYVHMKEVARLIKGFDWKLGWNQQNAFGLAGKCLAYMSRIDKKKFRMFYCSVDLEAWKKLKDEGLPLPEPIEMCNEFCVYIIQWWYTQEYPHETDILDLSKDAAHYFFDRDELFKEPFEKRWNEERNKFDETGGVSPWVVIDGVSSVEMKKVPGIQAADILAWSVNRQNTAVSGFPGTSYLHIMRQVIPAGSIEWNEANMRKKYGATLVP